MVRNFDDTENKFELVSCLNGGRFCQDHLHLINEKFAISTYYMRNKEYYKSVEELKVAFEATNELSGPSCERCAEFFRATITKSLENMQIDLDRMMKSRFGYNRYQVPYQHVTKTLNELKGHVLDHSDF
jgi:hypothetical protein